MSTHLLHLHPCFQLPSVLPPLKSPFFPPHRVPLAKTEKLELRDPLDLL